MIHLGHVYLHFQHHIVDVAQVVLGKALEEAQKGCVSDKLVCQLSLVRQAVHKLKHFPLLEVLPVICGARFVIGLLQELRCLVLQPKIKS